MNIFNLWGEEKALPHRRMPINKIRWSDGVRKSLFGKHLAIIQARNINCWQK